VRQREETFVDDSNATQHAASPERRRFDNGAGNIAHREFGHTKAPLSQWIAVYTIIAASILGAFSIIAGQWWMAWLAIAITVAAVAFAVVTSKQAKRSAEGSNPEAERTSAPNVRASR
jgi:ABC-type multidrug transport system fused ATPase/permease subunit